LRRFFQKAAYSFFLFSIMPQQRDQPALDGHALGRENAVVSLPRAQFQKSFCAAFFKKRLTLFSCSQ
jgi:hypothetical protein